MITKLRNWVKSSFFGIDRRIFLNIVLAAAAAAVLAAASFYQLLTGIWRTQFEASFLQRNREMLESLDGYLDDIRRLLANFSMQPETVRMLLGSYRDSFERYQCMLSVDNYLRNLGATHGIDSLLLVSQGAEWAYSVQYGEYALAEPQRERLLGALEDGGAWTAFALTDHYRPPWAGEGEERAAAVLKVFQMGRMLGYVAVPIETPALDTLLGGMQPDTPAAVLDRQDRVLCQSSAIPREIMDGLRNLAPGEARYSEAGGHMYIAAVSAALPSGARLLTLRRAYGMSVTEQRNYAYLVGVMLLILGVTVVATLLISHRIAKPVKLIMNEVRQVRRDNLRVSSLAGLDDEIMGDLFSSIQEMVRRIALLIADLSREHEMKKAAEIYALQQQINPHFIYNLLGTVDSIAEVYGCGAISQIVQNLSDMLRYSMNMGYANTAPLLEEYAHLVNYIEIQRICKGDRFVFTSELEPGLEGAEVLRLILQPLAENSFAYGVESHSRLVSISLRARRDGGDVVIGIRDDGCGMAPEKLAQVREAIYEEPAGISCGEAGGASARRDGHGLALRNVHWRIRLRYGGVYGLTVESRQGCGTVVSLRFPYGAR
jgi:two-component system sensor histidine kinase YesM